MRTGPPPRGQQIVTIVMMIALLVFVLVMRAQCAQGTAKFFGGLDTHDGGAAPAARDSGR